MEAMACGLPAVATATGGVKDILEDEIDGLLVEVGSERQLRDALDRLLGYCALARRLGGAARRAAEQRYSVATVTGRYMELFASVVDAS